MIRGYLVCSSFTLFSGKKLSNQVIKVAAAIELLNTAILIHDDILDDDSIRRGLDTFNSIHSQKENNHYGSNMAMMLGDITYALSFKLLNEAVNNNGISNIFSHELAWVSFAQILDYQSNYTTSDDVIQLYINKTGRYSISLPLEIGAILANANKEIIKTLKKISPYFGLIYQLKDDQLDIYGHEKKIGSDLKTGKKTLHYLKLKEIATKKDYITLKEINNTNQIEKYKQLLKKYHVNQYINKLLTTYKQKIISILNQTKFNDKQKHFFTDLIKYCLERNK